MEFLLNHPWLILPIWLVCAFINWGLTMGDFTHRYPWMKHKGIATAMAIFGPFGLPATLINSRHWRLKPRTYEERLGSFLEKMSPLTKEYFDARHK